MSITQIIQNAESLSLHERLEIIEALYASIKRELSKTDKETKRKLNEPFELITFNLGREVHVDRDEVYSERGV